MGDVTLTRFGTETDGDPARGCPHMVQWWPLYTRLVQLRLGIDLEIIQAAGTAAKSGATHVEGTAVDWRTWRFRDSVVDAAVALAREAGAPATWMRSRRRYRQNFDDHVHLALDCPCRSGADYQIAAVKAGYNGLDSRGRGGKDYHPKPSTWRNWSTGMAWMRSEIARLAPPSPPDPWETIMSYYKDRADFEKRLGDIIFTKSAEAVAAGLWQPVVPSDAGKTLEGSSFRNVLRHISVTVTAMAAKAGVEVDEEQIVRGLTDALLPGVRAVAVEAARSGGSPEAIADAVVAKLGTALAQD